LPQPENLSVERFSSVSVFCNRQKYAGEFELESSLAARAVTKKNLGPNPFGKSSRFSLILLHFFNFFSDFA
jgi:hypothetical protein